MIFIKVKFLGTGYCGFQYQKNGVSVQQVLCEAAMALFGGECAITGCSRTDAGVHANMFCCTLNDENAPNKVPVSAIPEAMNHFLPGDIAVYEASLVDLSFHPRYDAKEKEYIYRIWNSKLRDPFYEGRAYQYKPTIDIEKMNLAAKMFVGTHDFTSFSAADKSRKSSDNVRTVFDCSAEKTNEEDLVVIKIRGNGFLYNMVRIIAGTLLCVSEGKISPEDISSIILARDRKKAGPTAPACGLYLNKVIY